jgi:ABC-2 type transport system permease protein
VKSMPRRPRPPEIALGPTARAVSYAVRLGASGLIASPAVLVGRSLFFVLLMIVLSSFWDVVGRARVHGALAHVPAVGLALYVGVTEWMTLSVPALHLRLEDDIRFGALETHLLRPKPYLLMRIGEAAGAMLVRLGVLGVVALALLALSGRQGPSWPVYAGLLVLGPLGALNALLTSAIIGLTAFWTRRVIAAVLVMQKLSFLLGGLIAPVSLYPPWLARIAEFSPFAGQLYWPAALTLDAPSRTFAPALICEAVWIPVLALAAAALWRAGLRGALRRGC